jgi:hypothetical protein
MESTDSPTSPPAKRALVIVVRGLSPAMLGAYGNEWIHTPTIDRFAARGVVYDQHFASDLDAKNDAIDFGGIFDHPGLYARHFTTTSPSPRERHVLFALRRDVYEWMNTISPDQPALAVIHLALPGTLGSLKNSFMPSGGLVAQQKSDAGQSGSGRLADLGPGLRQWQENPLFGEGYATRDVSASASWPGRGPGR